MVATLQVRVQPRAFRSEVIGLSEGVLRVRVTSPPIKGKANQAVISLLAEKLGIRPTDLRILKGLNSRNKVIRIEGIRQDEALQRLGLQV